MNPRSRSNETKEKPQRSDLCDCDGVRQKSTILYKWLAETGNIDIMGRIAHGGGRNIQSLLSNAKFQDIQDLSKYTKQINLGSYSYSGLSTHPKVIDANIRTLKEYGMGLSGVRLLNGTTDLHRLFEKRIAEFVGKEDAVTYSSGFAANVGVIAGFCGVGDIIFSDALNHASIVDGMYMSKAKVIKYLHNNLKDLEAKLQEYPFETRKFIITDSVFSMDGDTADLHTIVRLAKKYNCFTIVDEAHGIGGYGPNLRGLVAKLDLVEEIDLITGSLSKGLPGGVGGFVLGSKKHMQILRYISNGYIFSASLPPNSCAGLIEALDLLTQDRSIELRLTSHQEYLRKELKKLGLHVLDGDSPIVPVIFKDTNYVYGLTRELHKRGIFVNPIKFPAVPKTSPRIRLNVTAALTQEDLVYFVKTIKEVLEVYKEPVNTQVNDVARPKL